MVNVREYTDTEVISMIESKTDRVLKTLQQVINMTPSELKQFHEGYMDFLSRKRDKDVVALDESFKFLLNEEDDVYDEKYRYLLHSSERRDIHRES